MSEDRFVHNGWGKHLPPPGSGLSLVDCFAVLEAVRDYPGSTTTEVATTCGALSRVQVRTRLDFLVEQERIRCYKERGALKWMVR